MSFHHSELFSNPEIMKSVLTLCSFLVCVIAPGPIADYCFVPCEDSIFDVHLICRRLHRCPKPKNCVVFEPNKQWRQTMLHIFNDARNAVANGNKKFDFGNPGATNMNALSYDLELEYIITCFINQCDTAEYLDVCVDSVRFRTKYFGVGYNLQAEFDMWLWKRVLEYYTEGELKVDVRTDEGIKCGKEIHPWMNIYYWEAKYVGCAAVRRPEWTIIICIMGPEHLKKGALVYRFAKHHNEIASECENGRNRKYPALCGDIEEVPADKMWAHQNITFNSSKNIVHVNNSFKIIMISVIVRIIFEVCD